MPVTIKRGMMKYKNPTTGEYVGVDVAAERTTAEQIALLEQKGQEVLDSLPETYNELATDVGQLETTVASNTGRIAAVESQKLSKPETNPNGSSGQILRSNGDGTVTWDNAATGEEVASATTAWLNEHVSGGQTIAIDDSLSVTGAAADAKKTGDEISDLKSAFNITDTVFEKGSYAYSLVVYTNNAMNDNTGEQGSENSKRASTPGLYYVPLGCDLYASNYNNTTFRPNVYCFDANKTYLGKISSSGIVPSQKITLINGTAYVRFFMVYAGGTTDITPQEATQAITYTAVYAGRIEGEIAGKQDVLTFDSVPTNGSNNPVKSGGVYDADKAISDSIKDIGEYSGLFLEYDFSGAVSGHYVGSNGAYQDSTSFSVSAPISVKKGEIVVLYARGYLQSVAMIARYDSTSNTYTSLVPSIDSTERVYTYTATSNITIVLSYRTENAHSCKIYNDVSAITDINSTKNTISKTGKTISVILNGAFGYQLTRKTDATKNLDTWLIDKTSANGVDLQVTSDIEGPMQLNGNGGVEADFIGGLHGDEQFTSATFVLDGTVMNPSNDWAKTEFTNFTVFITSNVYHAESNDIAFVRYKKLDFTGNVLTITNRWVCADSNGVDIVTATGCGIYSIDESKMTGYSTNYNNVFVSEQATDPNPRINQVQFLGPNYKITIKALEGMNLENSKGRVTRLSSASSTTGYRDKVYLYAWYAATAYHLDENADMLMSFSITCD